MTTIEEIERRIIIKRQLIEWTQEDIVELETKLEEELAEFNLRWERDHAKV